MRHITPFGSNRTIRKRFLCRAQWSRKYKKRLISKIIRKRRLKTETTGKTNKKKTHYLPKTGLLITLQFQRKKLTWLSLNEWLVTINSIIKKQIPSQLFSLKKQFIINQLKFNIHYQSQTITKDFFYKAQHPSCLRWSIDNIT